MERFTNIFLTVTLFSFFNFCFAHGIKTTPINGGVGVQFRYADNSPVKFKDVKIISPNVELFQNGVTDVNGCFLFFPNTAGEWKISVNDGKGHRATEIITVTKDFEYSFVDQNNFPLYYKIIFGVCVIFGLGGILVLFRSRSYRKN